MIDSNFQRSSILPSEKVFAYKMRMEAIKEYKWRVNEGRIPERNFEPFNPVCPVGTRDSKQSSADILSEQVNESKRQVYRYIQLTELIPEILEKVDESKIGLRTAVELSYISKETQKEIFSMLLGKDQYD